VFGTGERRLGIDAPFCFASRSKVAPEGAAVAEGLQAPVEGQLFSVKGLLQSGQKQPPEETSEHADRQKEVGPASDPTSAVAREAAACNDAMQVRVMAPPPTIP
jgi:hypothetical protein